MEKRVVGLTFAAYYGEFINRNNIETCYVAGYTEFPTTTFCVYVANTQSLSLRLPQHLCHRLDREHSDPEQYVVRAVTNLYHFPHVELQL